ncbi:bacterial polymer biosynthesis proteins, WecB/TagA/CpsF family [Bellilinea caldifistulae]|uniref:Glycosyl transferase n=1 Tax=Bellilinea caldifistulae TaxID=360411 RepID=A0A0P6XQS3_9CHLR|nr:WecB/TagA/CpsF family glycosyltransferase [Bellilinea caldifistulae]KPL77605.1 glycosyl transferase [Bellilinea caldifistulae]GAP09596.1 bacterial polymer biosynthesis proteins, WecB/TagA/CpsF family [Bellilinea caldifistulae]
MERLTLLGVKVDTLSIGELNHLVSGAINNGENILVANHNLHSIYLYHRDDKMKVFYQKADYIHIDGMPLVIWGRLLGHPLKPDQRVTYVDWIHPLMALAESKSFRVFYLGGKPGVAEQAVVILRSHYPNLQIQTHHGYFMEEEENKAVLNKIRDFQPNILMVGMGMPKQEHWVVDNLEKVSANVILTAGACFDYIAGVVPTPPRWMGRVGLEWLYRLLSEPRRLAKRYLVEPWALLPLAINDISKKLRL